MTMVFARPKGAKQSNKAATAAAKDARIDGLNFHSAVYSMGLTQVNSNISN